MDMGMDMNKEEETIDLRVLIRDIYKGIRKFLYLLPVLCGICATAVFGYQLLGYHPMYQAKASFTVSTLGNYMESNSTYGFYYNSSTAEQMTKLFPYILNSDALQELLKEDLEMDYLPGTLSASGVSGSNLITMRAVGSDPELAQRLLESALNYFPEVSRYVIGETKLNIIQPAVLNEEPYNRPDYTGGICKGILIGAALFCVLVAVYALLRKTIRKEDDLKENLNLACLGTIPKIRYKAHKKQKEKRIDIQNQRIDASYVHAMDRLAFQVEKKMASKEQKVLTVTSTLPGEGKSTVCWNLANTLALNGKRVLLVDADLRKPTLWRFCDTLTPLKGLTEYLHKEAKMEEIIFGQKEGVFLVSGCHATTSPHRLLGTKMLHEFFDAQRENFDYILIDTPPCEMMADANAVARCSDAVLYVVLQDHANSGQILDAIQNISANGTPLIGGVLNGVDTSFSGYGYRYNYYSKYGKYGRYGRHGRYGRYGESRNEG